MPYDAQFRHGCAGAHLREVFSGESRRSGEQHGEASCRVVPEHPPPAAERLPDREQQTLPGLLGRNLAVQGKHTCARVGTLLR